VLRDSHEPKRQHGNTATQIAYFALPPGAGAGTPSALVPRVDLAMAAKESLITTAEQTIRNRAIRPMIQSPMALSTVMLGVM
jgi:hypothetical protein